MATLATTHPTLLDVTKRLDPQGNIDTIAEILNQTNEILDDMVWLEGNLPTGHRSTIRTGLPVPTWRKLYGGVQPTKSRTAQVVDTCGMLEAYSVVDKAVAELNGNTAAFRLSEDTPQIEGISQELAQSLFYANEAEAPEEITGLAPRFNSKSAENGENILTSASTPDSTDNTSIWLVVWGPQTVHGIYPKGSKAGLEYQDLGEVTSENIDGNGGMAQVYRSHYVWKCGLVVKDWRYVVRINIDAEDLVKNAASGPDLLDLMGEATVLIPNLRAGRAAFYCNRKVATFFKKQVINKVGGSSLSIEQITNPVRGVTYQPMFEGIPIRRCDGIVNTESGVS